MTWPALTTKDDTVYFYYHASQFGMGKGNQRRKRQYRARHGRRTARRRGGLCLATLPADRFVALVPEDPVGEGVQSPGVAHLAGPQHGP